MGKKLLKKSSLIIVMIAALILAFVPKMISATNDNTVPTIEYSAHIQDNGWEKEFTKAGAKETVLEDPFHKDPESFTSRG